MNEQGLKPIEETQPEEKPKQDFGLPDLKKNVILNENNEDLIAKLPDWSIEPPLEINRGQK